MLSKSASLANASMGLRMDIHAPSVASASQGASEGQSIESRSVLELITEKDKVEAELTALGSVLDSVSLGYFP